MAASKDARLGKEPGLFAQPQQSSPAGALKAPPLILRNPDLLMPRPPEKQACDTVGFPKNNMNSRRQLCYASALGLGSHDHKRRSPQKRRAFNEHDMKTRARNAPLRFNSDHANGEPSPYNPDPFESKRDAIGESPGADDLLPRMRQLPPMRHIHSEEREWLFFREGGERPWRSGPKAKIARRAEGLGLSGVPPPGAYVRAFQTRVFRRYWGPRVPHWRMRSTGRLYTHRFFRILLGSIGAFQSATPKSHQVLADQFVHAGLSAEMPGPRQEYMERVPPTYAQFSGLLADKKPMIGLALFDSADITRDGLLNHYSLLLQGEAELSERLIVAMLFTLDPIETAACSFFVHVVCHL